MSHRNYQGQFVDPAQMDRTDRQLLPGRGDARLLHPQLDLRRCRLFAALEQQQHPAPWNTSSSRCLYGSASRTRLAPMRMVPVVARRRWLCRPRRGRAWSCAVGCATRVPADAPLDRGRRASSEDRIGIDDTFDVRVYGETELTGTFRVATDGSVDYPLAGRIQVGGPAHRRDSAAAGRPAEGPLPEGSAGRRHDQGPQQPEDLGPRAGREAGPGRLLPEHDDRRRHRERRRVHRHRRQELGEPPPRGWRARSRRTIYPVADISEGRSPNVMVLPGDVLVVDERVF